MAKGVKLIAALMEEEHDDRLLDATRRLCSAFSDLLNAAQPENKEVKLSDLYSPLVPFFFFFFLIAALKIDRMRCCPCTVGASISWEWLIRLILSVRHQFTRGVIIIIDVGVGFCIARGELKRAGGRACCS